MEVASTREHPPVCGRYVHTSIYFDRLGTDGKREHHDLRCLPSEMQSSMPCEWTGVSLPPRHIE